MQGQEPETYSRGIAREVPQDIQMLDMMGVGEIRHKIARFIVETELLVIWQDIIGKVNEEHKFQGDGEILHNIFLFGEDRVGIKKMDHDLCTPDLSSQEHRHEAGLGGELEIGLFDLMLDDTSIDIIKRAFNHHRVAVWAVIIR